MSDRINEHRSFPHAHVARRSGSTALGANHSQIYEGENSMPETQSKSKRGLFEHLATRSSARRVRCGMDRNKARSCPRHQISARQPESDFRVEIVKFVPLHHVGVAFSKQIAMTTVHR
jgi:hypothetical protein